MGPAGRTYCVEVKGQLSHTKKTVNMSANEWKISKSLGESKVRSQTHSAFKKAAFSLFLGLCLRARHHRHLARPANDASMARESP